MPVPPYRRTIIHQFDQLIVVSWRQHEAAAPNSSTERLFEPDY
jgi:hypothetical protein